MWLQFLHFSGRNDFFLSLYVSISENICNFASQSVNMFDIEPFKIDLRAVNQEVEHFEFTLTDEYFETIKAPDIHKGNLSVELTLRKMAGSFMLSFHIVGTIVVQCAYKEPVQQMQPDLGYGMQ